MIRGFYNAAAALDTAMQNHEVVAQNIANATVPGYRRQGMAFQTIEATANQGGAKVPGEKLLGPETARVFNVFDPGESRYTGNPLDVAIKGDSFFALEGPKGPLYTRNGVFEMNSQGELRSNNGMPVSGEGGKITIPQGTGQITISKDGTVLADNNPVGKLKLTRFGNTSALTPAGTTLFEAPPSAAPQAGTGQVEQGYREGSNVQIVNEMVAMIAGMRQYEAAQRAMRALSDAIQQNSRPQGG